MQIDGNCKLLDSARFMRAMKLLKISIAEKSPSLKLVQGMNMQGMNMLQNNHRQTN